MSLNLEVEDEEPTESRFFTSDEKGSTGDGASSPEGGDEEDVGSEVWVINWK